jgi:hypothetical protein
LILASVVNSSLVRNSDGAHLYRFFVNLQGLLGRKVQLSGDRRCHKGIFKPKISKLLREVKQNRKISTCNLVIVGFILATLGIDQRNRIDFPCNLLFRLIMFVQG